MASAHPYSQPASAAPAAGRRVCSGAAACGQEASRTLAREAAAVPMPRRHNTPCKDIVGALRQPDIDGVCRYVRAGGPGIPDRSFRTPTGTDCADRVASGWAALRMQEER